MSDDLIKRSDAIGACAYETIECYKARKAIRALPSADRPSAVDLSSVYSTAYKSGYEKGKADRPQGEWIPCSERLPEEDGEYLITLDFEWGREIEIGLYADGEWLNDNRHANIAWRPLIEPWKGVDNEDN